MRNKLMLGLWVARSAQDVVAKLDFMTEEHHLVRDFAVREIPRVGQPLAPQLIAGEVDLPTDRVVELLDELEKEMTFLYRGDGENVTWAYPVTADRTPHHVTFSTGEEVHAA